ncbi:MAG: rod shape-determining protein MreC [Muribaculaceae bacterium]|nr:rod shape-determining protein MreC [Muribaculaceae bacterium]
MRNLFNFLLRYSSWVVFAFYVVVSFVLLFTRNPYQRHVYLTSAGDVASTVYEGASTVTSYFHLRDINDDLQQRLATLEGELLAAQAQIDEMALQIHADTMTTVEALQPYRFIIARVINNSITRDHNYITINRGRADGLRPEMGVVNQNGVVGVVDVAGERYARVISLLNPDFRLSCRLRADDGVFGSLVWDGKSPYEAVLEELPRHTVWEVGDTVVTSGYSAMFPAGIPVGTVTGTSRDNDDNFFKLRVKLLTEFDHLSTVRVIANNMADSIKAVEGADQ